MLALKMLFFLILKVANLFLDTIENQEPAGNDKYSFLIAQQAQARWEELYDFAVYSAVHKG